MQKLKKAVEGKIERDDLDEVLSCLRELREKVTPYSSGAASMQSRYRRPPAGSRNVMGCCMFCGLMSDILAPKLVYSPMHTSINQ